MVQELGALGEREEGGLGERKIESRRVLKRYCTRIAGRDVCWIGSGCLLSACWHSTNTSNNAHFNWGDCSVSERRPPMGPERLSGVRRFVRTPESSPSTGSQKAIQRGSCELLGGPQYPRLSLERNPANGLLRRGSGNVASLSDDGPLETA